MDKRWPGCVIMLLGIWLFVSPWAVQYAAQETAAANAYALGGTIVFFGAVAMYAPKAWDEIVNLLLGAWMIASPFVLQFASDYAAAINAVIVGALIMVLASWAIDMDADFDEWWHEHRLF